MKIFRIILIVILVVLVIAFVGGFIFLKTLDVNRYKPQIIEQASIALGRPFNFNDIQLQVSLKDGIRLNLKQLTIGDDARFGQGNFLTVDNVFLGVDLLSFLTKGGKIAVSKVDILSPQIVLIKNKAGELNAQTIGTKPSAALEPQTVNPDQASTPPPAQVPVRKEAAKPPALPPIFVSTINVENAEITYIDQSFAPPLSVKADQLNTQISNFSFDQLFSFTVSGRIFGAEKNFKVNGKAKVNIAKSEITGKNISVAVDLGKFSLEQIKALPMVKGVPFPETLQGQLQVTVKDMMAGPQGLAKVAADVELSQGSVAVKEVAPGISLAASKIGLKLSDFSLDKPFGFKVQAASFSPQPNISLEGQAKLDITKQAVQLANTSFSTDLSLLSLPELRSSMAALKGVPFPDVLGGVLKVTVKDLAAGPQGLGKIAADVQFTDGHVRVKDVDPGVNFEASKIGLNIINVSLSDPFKFSLQAAYLSSVPNISLDGQAQVDPVEQTIQLKNTKLSTDLSSFNMKELRASVAALKDVPFPEGLHGKINLNISDMTAGPTGVMSLISQGELTEGSAQLKELTVPVSPIKAKFTTTKSQFNLDDLFVGVGKGSFKASAVVDDFLGKQIFNADFDLRGIDLKEILEQKDKEVKVEGLVFGALTVSGQGLKPENTNLIQGDSNLEIKEGKLANLNILKMVIDKLNVIPNLGNSVTASLSESSRAKLEQKDTILNKVAMKTKISQGVILVNPIDIDADGFQFTGQTQAGFDQKFATEGSFFIPPDLSADIIKSAPQLEFLLTEERKIFFPLKVSGKFPEMSVFPDVAYIGSKIVQNKGKSELKKIINKAIGLPEEDGSSQAPSDGTEPSAPTEKSPEKEIIDNIFDKIFK